MLSQSLILCVVFTSLYFSTSLPMSSAATHSGKINKLTKLPQLTASQERIIWTKDDEEKLGVQISQVALPALAASIVEPALTMIDMYFVGTQKNIIAATGGLAGLSVTGALFNIIAAVTYPLCSGTTAVISRAQGSVDSADSEKKSSPLGSILLNGVLLSTVTGTVIATFLIKYARTLLVRGFDLEPDVLKMTVNYIKIRGLSLPFSLMQLVLIGFCLAVQDVNTPLVSIAGSSIANIIGDFILVYRLNMGLEGAAIATAMACVVSSLISLSRLFFRYIDYDKTKSLFSNIKLWIKKLDFPAMKQFFETSTALLVGLLANQLTYSAGAKISSYVSNVPKVTPVPGTPVTHIAGHQIAMQIWWFLSYFSTPLSFAGQAILPRDIKNGNIIRANRAISKITSYGVAMGIGCTIINIFFLTFAKNVFTSDVAVQSAFKAVLPQVALSQLFISLCTTMDGIFIGTDKITDYVILSILSTISSWAYYIFIAIKQYKGITGTWNGLLIFGTTRLMYHIFKIIRGNFHIPDIDRIDLNFGSLPPSGQYSLPRNNDRKSRKINKATSINASNVSNFISTNEGVICADNINNISNKELESKKENEKMIDQLTNTEVIITDMINITNIDSKDSNTEQ